MKPVIAMPLAGTQPFRKFMNSRYVMSLNRAGAKVRWIPLEDPNIIEIMMECDGLLLPGGGDVDPKYYGQLPTEKCGKPFPLRDKVEFEMLEKFISTGKPILGICRGEQVMNVYFGGTLHQCIKATQRCSHSNNPSKYKGIHGINITPGTKLHQILEIEYTSVNSMHHQAVDSVAEGVVVSAVSEDGFVEAIEKPDHPFCIGIQWHPEHMSKRVKRQRKIFTAFVNACKK